MRDLSLCLRPVETESQHLAAHDERFLRITDLAQGARYTEVADAVETLLAEDAYEVRLLGYYLYAVFHEEGMVRLPDVLETLNVLVEKLGGSLPPADKQLKLLNKGVTWFSQQLMDTLRYHQTKKDERWASWLKETTGARAKQAGAKAQQFYELLSAPTYRTAAEAAQGLVPWLRDFEKQLAERPAPEAAQAAPKAETSSKSKAPDPTPVEEPSPFVRVGQVMQLRGSAHLVDLCNKLKAFEMLIERQDFQKAALVSDDILGSLEGFDPRRYFPELFASFGGLLNKHVREIQEFWEGKDSVEWKTLAQFYQVDLEGFVKRK